MTTDGRHRSSEEAMHIAWSKTHFASLKDQGVWGVPRTGLMFQRQGDALVLIQRMPHDPKMPISAAELDEIQQDDFEVIASKFRAAGIEVRDKTRMI